MDVAGETNGWAAGCLDKVGEKGREIVRLRDGENGKNRFENFWAAACWPWFSSHPFQVLLRLLLKLSSFRQIQTLTLSDLARRGTKGSCI